MAIIFLFKGLIIGFSIAAPVGPIGVLCIRRTLAEGRASGLVSGLGAATADAIYGSIAGFGLTFISNFLISQHIWLRLVGGAFLCYLGLKTFLSKPAEQAATARGNGLRGAYASTFFLTLTNPMTILSFAAIFAGLGLASRSANYVSAAALVLGVFVGSALWWFILSGGERQFLGIATALIRKADLLMLDEPSAMLSPKFASIIFSKIQELKERFGLMILLVEQNVKKALEISDNAYMLMNGRIVFEGTAKELLEHEKFERFLIGI